ncbi:MAG: hypothetical protein ACPGVK_08055 [Halocynthiibacter sp.]
MRNIAPIIARAFVTVLLAVSLVSVGFAHKTQATALPPELIDYVSSGGALADICGGDFDGDGQSAPVSCEACRIVDSLSITEPLAFLPVVLPAEIRRFHFIAKRVHHSRGLDPTRLTRAPPQA